MISLLKKSIQHERPCLPGLVMTVLFLSLPNLVAVFWPRVDQHHVENFWLGVGILLAPCLFSVSVRTALRLWLPLAAFLPALMAYHFVTGEPVREWAFVVLGETDASELERFWAPAVLAVLAAPCAMAFLWWFTGRHVPAGHRLGWLARGVVMVCLVVMPLGQMVFGGWGLGGQVAVKRLATTFPANLPVSAWRAWEIHDDFAGRTAVAERMEVKSAPLGDREIYVLVLGESARFDSFQIHGYARETTPLLAKMSGLLSFQDVVAPAPVTSMSVPLLLTPANPEHLRAAASLPSVVSIFRRAGFHTAWYSTQRKHGMYDTASSVFARDAEESRFLSGTFAPGNARYASAYDGNLLQPLKELLATGHRRLFIVLHTMGSHQNYADRYPAEFNHFPAERQDIASRPFVRALTGEQREHLSNAYDNSIRYTDWFLAQVIETLKQANAVSMMLYVSDHGQNKGDAETLPFAHGNLTPEVMHIPMLVWLSPEYRAQRQEQTMQMESHVGTPFTGSAVFHTMVDAAALQCDALDLRLSAASPQFRPGPRLLRNLKGELVDYDTLPVVLNAGKSATLGISAGTNIHSVPR
ncbi:glucan phosphoethanolaminetransferase (alkaline phosphatase superfamily) [Roseimicrobium gellanilyticum]|uniref:Glucan phosphoethanolaminetransferase (Alkaline phosphatase superfamily) n=1 Tax=Roseimicrobium gellanilyticum TaxID=748857 RepID=A0A366HVN2_9BACT|nr:phosphoethanolamine transferase [Roseimicrobium gellanilyticum]RBP48157.1 glucan phosphoethanolaminetransferase (alkaline phosphatase superfamily) [Roseimicrobium gellanilyticum]